MQKLEILILTGPYPQRNPFKAMEQKNRTHISEICPSTADIDMRVSISILLEIYVPNGEESSWPN